MLAPQMLTDLQNRIHAADLSSHADAIVTAARPAIDLILDGKSAGTLGETRFGGAPDLPIGTAWPRNARGELLAFLAQINLSEIPKFADNSLPARGWLSVFVGSDESLQDMEHRVILIDGDAQLAPYLAPADANWAAEDFHDMAPHRVKLRLRADVPHYCTNAFEELARDLAPTEDEVDDISDALMSLTPTTMDDRIAPYIGQLLGHASGLNGDPAETAFVTREMDTELLRHREFIRSLDKTPARDWISLLHLESIFAPDLRFCVWDAGFLSFMIHRDDLARRDFSRIYVGGESS